MRSEPSRPIVAITTVLAWQPAGIAVQLVGLAVLSRLLDPSDFGTFALILAIYSLASTAVDFGISSNLFRGDSSTLSKDDLSSAYGLWLAMSCPPTLGFAIAAAFQGFRGNDPDATAMLVFFALTIALAGPILAAEVRQRHALEMGLLARLPVLTGLINVVVAGAGALLGLGAAALAMGLLATQIVQLTVLKVSQRHAETIAPRLAGWRRYLSFGSAYTMTSLLPKLSETLKLSIITGLLGPVALGFFDRAKVVAQLNERAIVNNMVPLALPIMAHSRRAGDRLEQVYLKKVDLLAAICWPAALVVALLADPLVAVLLGPDWTETVRLVQIMALSGLSYPINKMWIKIFAILEAERVALRLQVGQQVFSFLLVSGAAFISLPAVCLAVSLAHCVKALRIAKTLKSYLSYPTGAMRDIAIRNGLVSVMSGLPCLGLVLLAPNWGALGTLAVGIPLAAGGWMTGLAVTDHDLLAKMGAAVRVVASWWGHLSGRK